MSMYNDDEIEMGYPRGEGPSRNAIDEHEIQPSEPTDEVEAHDRNYLSKETCDLIKHNQSESFWRDIDSDILLQESPLGNGVLHMAAQYGNDNCMERYLQSFGHQRYDRNINDDTALHVAARAGHISTLEKLFTFMLNNVTYSQSQFPKEALDCILMKNRQGNTFFHEAFLNGHKDVMNILGSQELKVEAGFLELLERVALFWTNNEEKSVLHLAIEKGYKDIVDHALTKLISQHPALDKLIENKELAKMIPHRLPPVKIPVPRVYVDMKIMDKWREWSQRLRRYQELSLDYPKDKLPESHQNPAQLIPYGHYYVPLGQSPLILAILKQDQDILRIILKKKKEWIYLRDNEGRTAFHYAASIGYLNGVKDLLESCISCHVDRDIYGLFPLHLASAGGHVEVVKKLLEHCADPKEILDKYDRNIVHIAAEIGKLNVVRYILQNANHELVKMINDKDANGNTPLHLATLHCHPKIVHALTRDKSVDLSLVNRNNQTALDVYMQFLQENPSLPQRLVWIALESAGIKYAKRGFHSAKVPRSSQSAESVCKQKAPINMDPYKDRINTLMLVSTLIITVTFAAGFTLPGGTNGSNPGQGMAVMLNHVWFKLFIFCIAISMYGAISVTIILIWAQLGDITLAIFSLQMARPLLGVTLATLSVAFMAGIHLVISDLSWLATAFLVLCVISILMLLLLYTVLWFPSSSSNPVIRYISYYPFKLLTWLVERDETEAGIGEPIIYIRQCTTAKKEEEGGGDESEEKKKRPIE